VFTVDAAEIPSQRRDIFQQMWHLRCSGERMPHLRLVASTRVHVLPRRHRAHRQQALVAATRIITEWLSSDLDDPDMVYPELARRIAVALARRDAEIARLRTLRENAVEPGAPGALGST
jgi:hypothetical protein